MGKFTLSNDDLRKKLISGNIFEYRWISFNIDLTVKMVVHFCVLSLQKLPVH